MTIIAIYENVGYIPGHGRDLRDDAQDRQAGDRPGRGRRHAASEEGTQAQLRGCGRLVAERVQRSKGWISAKRLLPAARTAGYTGSDRNFRRLVAAAKKDWRGTHHRGCRRRCGPRVSIWSSTGA